LISKRSIFWLALILMPFVMAACSDTSSSLGQYHEGRILLLNVLEIDRTDELLYSTIDPEDVIRKWRIKPSKAGQELLLMRFKVENHVAVNTVLVVDEQSVVIEGFFENDYRPISVNRTVILDQRGQGEGTVTVADGECTDHARLVVNAGTNVQWTNRGESGTAIQFGAGAVPGLGDGLVQIAPGGSVSNRFDQP